MPRATTRFRRGEPARAEQVNHADGAWGGLGAAVPALAPRYVGVGGVDSLTVDPHKTLSVPVGCGALLLPDPEHLHTAFAHQASCLTAGEPDALPWLSHATIELTRPGTRALGLWATLHHLGRDGVTGLIEYYLTLADGLRERIAAEPRLQLLEGGPWPVACFRITDPDGGEPDALHTRIARRLQDKGRVYLATSPSRAAPSCAPVCATTAPPRTTSTC